MGKDKTQNDIVQMRAQRAAGAAFANLMNESPYHTKSDIAASLHDATREILNRQIQINGGAPHE